MSSDFAIRFEGVGKEYRVGSSQRGGRFKYQSLGERIGGALRNPLRAAKDAVHGQPSDAFWALKDVSFAVQPGEVIGIIGRNGAGKSTLLKVLSQITKPTEGQIAVRGRVGSLLEVGTGFHPELTGRENIFLNGAILGMTRREVQNNFDAIVAFSEVERFLDTPVKQYSSGMYTRLAFAVAAHLDPEVLVVDEVLAVGDAAFQKKCLGKMRDVASGGRTVLFVSHNMTAIQTLCSTAVHLIGGRVALHGSVDTAVTDYMRSSLASNNIERPACPTGRPTITKATVGIAQYGEQTRVILNATIDSAASRTCALDLHLESASGERVGFGSLGLFNSNDLIQLQSGSTRVSASFDATKLALGSYVLGIKLSEPMVEYFDEVQESLLFSLETSPSTFDKSRVLLQEWRRGCLDLDLHRIDDMQTASSAWERQ